MSLDFEVTFGLVTLTSKTVFVIEDPHLDLTVVSTGGKETLFKG